MANFKTQVEDLIGSVGDDALITQSLLDIGGEIIAALPNNKLLSSSLAASISSGGIGVSDKKVLSVDKDDLPAKKVTVNQKARYNDTASIYAATDTNPVYYIESEKLYVNGAAGSGPTSGVLHYVPKLPVNSAGSALISNTSDGVSNFPLEAEHILILGSAVRCLQRLMADKTSSLPSDISSPVLSEVSISLPTFTAPDSFVLMPSPAGVNIDYSSVPTSPSYVQPILSLSSAPTISDLTITSNSPVAPTSPSFTTPDIASTTLNNLGVPPIYTSPSTTINGVAWATEYPSQASAITTAFLYLKAAVDQAETAGDKFASATSDSQFDTNATWDATNSQLTRVKDALDKVSALVSANSPASSYDAHDLLQAEDLELLQGNLSIVQVELQRAQVHISEWVSVGDMRVKEINAALSEAQGYASEIQSRLSLTPMKISEYQTKVQDSLNEFNQANVSYQAKLQEAVQQAQLSSREADQEANLKLQKEQQEYSAKLQKYQSEVSEYQANISKEVQQYTQNLEGDLRVWQAERQTDLQKYSSDIQKETSRFQSDFSIYQQEIQKAIQTYQSETGYDMSKHSAEIQSQTSRFSSDLQKNTETFRTSMERYSNDLRKVSEVNQSKLSKYGADIQNYGSKIQKHSADYQWKQGQYAQLKAEYTQGLQQLISR